MVKETNTLMLFLPSSHFQGLGEGGDESKMTYAQKLEAQKDKKLSAKQLRGLLLGRVQVGEESVDFKSTE